MKQALIYTSLLLASVILYTSQISLRRATTYLVQDTVLIDKQRMLLNRAIQNTEEALSWAKLFRQQRDSLEKRLILCGCLVNEKKIGKLKRKNPSKQLQSRIKDVFGEVWYSDDADIKLSDSTIYRKYIPFTSPLKTEPHTGTLEPENGWRYHQKYQDSLLTIRMHKNGYYYDSLLFEWMLRVPVIDSL